ncbi:hypothetical protein EWF20_06280 [Sulfolobus sp. S-194]|uniref:hypothetical protein n=1 Tax=Sulfolobus sp. S-194 TaxID=2512240 RepID=UPI001436D61A|nr:hypothetical protein [Sulfolobus sp. S-194]QIW23800.1 hypothetical protein EWF20_06280 [Sulfolobus sp. S-194]
MDKLFINTINRISNGKRVDLTNGLMGKYINYLIVDILYGDEVGDKCHGHTVIKNVVYNGSKLEAKGWRYRGRGNGGWLDETFY